MKANAKHASVTRRDLVKGAGVAAVGAAAIAPVAAKAAEAAGEDIVWENEADLVVVGGGVAALSCAVTAYVEELGTAVILEAAPEGFEGGNSRVCGQGALIPDTVEDGIAYLTYMCGDYDVDADQIEAWAVNIRENWDWLQENIGWEPVQMGASEYPEAPSNEAMKWYGHQGIAKPNGHTWQLFRDLVDDYDIPYYLEARAIEFIKDSEGVVMGVRCEDGRCFKANKAVVMACGGFEYNQTMMNMANTIGFSGIRGTGGWYNRGDGIKMVQSIGAELWNMNNFSGNRIAVKIVDPNDEYKLAQAKFGLKEDNHDYIIVGPDGERFCYEELLGQTRHGKTKISGVWTHIQIPGESYAIFNEKSFGYDIFGQPGFAKRIELITGAISTYQSNQELLDAGIIKKCETVAEVAEFTGISESALQYTLDEYNGYVENQYDPDFHRGEASSDEGVKAFTTSVDGVQQGNVQADIEAFDLVPVVAPYYVVRLYHGILNTQGGPRRSPKGEVLDTNRQPIPRVYAAGEFGAIYAYMYNLGGNFSEAMSSGRLAARSACALEPRA